MIARVGSVMRGTNTPASNDIAYGVCPPHLHVFARFQTFQNVTEGASFGPAVPFRQ